MAPPPSSLINSIYNAVFKRNSIMLLTVFSGAFGLQLAYDTGANLVWDNINKGRQWKDIKYRYVQKEEDEE